jgi:hypothetical protein
MPFDRFLVLVSKFSFTFETSIDENILMEANEVANKVMIINENIMTKSLDLIFI